MNTTAQTTNTDGREPLVLVHGIGASSDCWDTVVAPLQERYEVIVVDLPGHFRGPDLPKGTRANIKSLADAVEQMIKDAGHTSAHLVGNSLGGAIVLELGSRGIARSVTALAPAGGVRRYSWPEIRIIPLFFFQRILSRIGLPLRNWLVKSAWRRREALKFVTERGDLLRPQVAAAMMEAFVGCRIFWRIIFNEARGRRLKSTPISCPVAIVWGSKDRVLPINSWPDRWIKELPDAKWHMWPGVGHMPMVDDAQRTVQVIEQTASEVRTEIPAAA